MSGPPSQTLPGGLIVSRLGFGCSGLMARLSRAQSLGLLAAAFDSGITHFDAARMYGYGEAEGVLGEFIQSRRSQVTITTKVGILPPAKSRLMDVARGLARTAASLHPAVRNALRRKAEAMTQAGCFDIPVIRASLQASLRVLRTDYVDVLLLHDCTLADLQDPALANFLAEAQASGIARHVGLATAFEVSAEASRRYAALTGTVQFANNPWQRAMDGASWTAGRAVFTHSALGARFAAIRPALAADPLLAAEWSGQLGYDALDTGRLAATFLAAALEANPAGCVLFSSRRPSVIAANADGGPKPGSWATLCHLVATLPGPAFA